MVSKSRASHPTHPSRAGRTRGSLSRARARGERPNRRSGAHELTSVSKVAPPPCFAFLRSELLEAKKGRAACVFQPSPEMLNPAGVVQGGILAGFLDNVIGPAIYSVVGDRTVVTIQMNINFLRPARLGDRLRGAAQVIKQGRTQLYVEASLSRDDRSLVARASTVALVLEDAS